MTANDGLQERVARMREGLSQIVGELDALEERMRRSTTATVRLRTPIGTLPSGMAPPQSVRAPQPIASPQPVASPPVVVHPASVAPATAPPRSGDTMNLLCPIAESLPTESLPPPASLVTPTRRLPEPGAARYSVSHPEMRRAQNRR
jgi:hypothetical protein